MLFTIVVVGDGGGGGCAMYVLNQAFFARFASTLSAVKLCGVVEIVVVAAVLSLNLAVQARTPHVKAERWLLLLALFVKRQVVRSSSAGIDDTDDVIRVFDSSGSMFLRLEVGGS